MRRNACKESTPQLVPTTTRTRDHMHARRISHQLGHPFWGRVKVVHVHQVRVGPNLMDPIVLFLREDILPEDKLETDKIRRKASHFWLSEDQKLYKCSFSGPYLLCIHPEASELLLKELHEGICGSHTGGKSLSHKAITQGYYG